MNPGPAAPLGGATSNPAASMHVKSVLRDLHERAKELNCLCAVEALVGDDALSLAQVCEGVARAAPSGWQFPELCRVHVALDGVSAETPGFARTAWAMQAPIEAHGEPAGSIEVCYTAEAPAADEGPFLKEERKLIEVLADRLGSCLTHRRLMHRMREMQLTQRKIETVSEHDWGVIIDLLRRTDKALLLRVARKLINYLCWNGVKEADRLLQLFGAGLSRGRQLMGEINSPTDLGEAPDPDVLVERAFRVAVRHLSDEEIVNCIEKWIKQDRASLLVNTLERDYTSLAEIGDAIHRFQHATHGEVELSDSVRRGLQVMMIKRFLTDQLEYIRVAKHYVDVKDFHELMQRVIYPARGHGKLGGKSAGMFLAGQIVKRHAQQEPLLENFRTPKTWYLTSDGLYDFAYCNHLEDVFTQKYKDIDEVRQEYPYIVQVFRHSYFSSDMIKGLSLALDDLGESPLVVRSSSLLEDRFGAAFSGKYKSLFLANQGPKRERLAALTDAIAEIYASVFSPDPILYRAERNLLDFAEGMGIMIQEVVGVRCRDYFLPTFAGVAFSHNEFRWSPRIKREDGLVRLVPGLGTRAVDRTGDDYPILASPGQPGLRVNGTPQESVRYSPKQLDVINLKTNAFETVEAASFLRECGENIPGIEHVASIYEHGTLRIPMKGQVDFEAQDVVVTFEGLLSRTPFLKQMRTLLSILEEQMQTPVDVEFASTGSDIYILQCRAQSPAQHCTPSPIPHDVDPQRVVFSARRFVSNGRVPAVTHIVYVDPQRYAGLPTLDELMSVGRCVGRLNKILPKQQFVLMGPGRWGSRGDIKLGVRVTYSDINNTAMLIEIARRRGDYTPDLSFGTHFFQDLVEASIRYLPLYPDDEGVAFNEAFLLEAPNVLPQLAPEFAHLTDVVRVIDVPGCTNGLVMRVYMNADVDEALAILAPPAAVIESAEPEPAKTRPAREQDCRWRMRMAERIAEQLDPVKYGVKALYIFGSVKNGTAGPGSDVDLLIHHEATPPQRAALEQWLDGWSRALAELNYLRTGYRMEGLLDLHWVSDLEIESHAEFAVKIDATTDAARPLPLRAAD